MNEAAVEDLTPTAVERSDGRILTGLLALPASILRKIDPEPMSGCWLWNGARTGSDRAYGQAWLNGRHLAHRLVYRLLRGPIPDGLHLDHLCRNRCCVNPDHLDPVTGRENTIRGTGFIARNVARTHCPQGHALSGENLYLWHGHRHCRACDSDRATRRRLAGYVPPCRRKVTH